ncbi:MAG: PIN domain nuclease [Sporichthyaceae bacterium]
MTVYLVDKSAWALQARHPQVGEGIVALFAKGRLACCEIVALELFYSARNSANYRALRTELTAARWIEVTNETLTRAMEVQEALVEIGKHRLPVADLIVAASAEQSRVTVLHNDHDFDTIAEVTGQPVVNVLELWPPT